MGQKVTVTLSLLTISGGVESVTQENVVTRLFSATQGVYSITVQEFLTYAENRVPNGYVLIGFTGGFFGDEIVSSDGWSAYSTYLVYETGFLTRFMRCMRVCIQSDMIPVTVPIQIHITETKVLSKAEW